MRKILVLGLVSSCLVIAGCVGTLTGGAGATVATVAQTIAATDRVVGAVSAAAVERRERKRLERIEEYGTGLCTELTRAEFDALPEVERVGLANFCARRDAR